MFNRSNSWIIRTIALGVFLSSGVASAAMGSSWYQSQGWGNNNNDDRVMDRRSGLMRDVRSLATPFAPGSNNVSLDVGQVFLMGDLGQYSDSIGSQLHYTYGVSDLFGFDASVGYSDHSDGKFSMVSALAGLRTNLSWYDKVVPYFVFGLGFYKPNYSSVQAATVTGTATGASISPLLFGVHLGPGVNLEITKQFFFGASLTFHDAFGSSRFTTDGKSINVGGTFTSFLLSAGVTF